MGRTAIDILAVTLSAQIFTLPIIIHNFGLVSLSAPLSNIFVLAAMPWLMGFGFISAFLGIFSKFWAWVFGLPVKIILWYFFAVVSLFSRQWMALEFFNVSWALPIGYYILVVVIIIWWRKRHAFE